MNQLEAWRIWDVHEGVWLATGRKDGLPEDAKPLEPDMAAWLVDRWFREGFADGHSHGVLRAIYTNLARRGARGPDEPMPPPSRLRETIREALRRGTLIAFRQKLVLTSGDIAPSVLPDLGPAPPEKEKIRDLIVFCKHDIDGRQRCVHGGEQIEVVADAGEMEDEITILYRDDSDPPPAQLDVSWHNGSLKAAKTGTEGAGYANYKFKAKYPDWKKSSIISSEFWSQINKGTPIQVSGIPESVSIIHYSPHKWKLEVMIPQLRGLKMGSRLGDGQVSQRYAAMDRPKGTFEESKDIVKLSRDGNKIALERGDIESFLQIYKYAVAVYDFIRTIKDNVPKVGWYADFELQLLQGPVAAEWGWKEFDDHRAFLWYSVGVEVTIFSVQFELGVGLQITGFKAQLFAQLSGSVGAKLVGERTSPDNDVQIQATYDRRITGALGVRFEAGEVVKLEGKGETAIGVSGDITWESSKGLSGGIKGYWTGITTSYTFSVKHGALGYERSGQKRLVDEATIGEKRWPEKEKYNPEYVTRDRIKSIVSDKLTQGWNVRVFTPSDAWYKPDTGWSIDQIAERLAAKIDARADIRRDAKSIEGLAHDIRQRLDVLGERWGRDYIEAARFESFVNGELDAMMTATYIDPVRDALLRSGAEVGGAK